MMYIQLLVIITLVNYMCFIRANDDQNKCVESVQDSSNVKKINTDSTYNLRGVKSQAGSIDGGGSGGSGSSDGKGKVGKVGKNPAPAPVPGPPGKPYSFIVVEFLFNFVCLN